MMSGMRPGKTGCIPDIHFVMKIMSGIGPVMSGIVPAMSGIWPEMSGTGAKSTWQHSRPQYGNVPDLSRGQDSAVDPIYPLVVSLVYPLVLRTMIT